MPTVSWAVAGGDRRMTRAAPLLVVPLLFGACSTSAAPQALPARTLAPTTSAAIPTGASLVKPEVSCGPRPAPASAALLEATLTFPPAVSNRSAGQLTVRNASSKLVTLEVNEGYQANAVQGSSITSQGPPSAEAVVLTTFAPGQTLVIPVVLAGYACSRNVDDDLPGQIPNGPYDVLAVLQVHGGPRLASGVVKVNYQAGA